MAIADKPRTLAPRPLDRFPLVRASSIEQAQQALARIYARPVLKLDDRVRSLAAAINNYQMQNVGLSYATYGAAVCLDFSEPDWFVQCYPLRGRGLTTVGKHLISLDPDSGATISPNTEYLASYSADYEHLVLRIAAPALTRKLAAMTGAAISAPLLMDPAPDYARPEARLCRNYVMFLVGELSLATAPLPEWAQAEIEQMVMVMFLHGNRHNYSHLLEQKSADLAPWQLRRAEKSMATDWLNLSPWRASRPSPQ